MADVLISDRKEDGCPATADATPLCGESSGHALATAHVVQARTDGVRSLCAAAQGRCGQPFEFPLASFLALFGDPAKHDYGSHELDSSEGNWKRTVIVDRQASIDEFLSDCPVGAVVGLLTVRHDDNNTAALWTERAGGQTGLAESLAAAARSKPTASEQAQKAAAKAAVESSKDPFVVDSDSEASDGGTAAKRPRI
mmetsp:Transcript_102307/g.203088  ORF Transcript_102307/g.203088 Transcript_102307/m.203088 type:complete len:197 (-) Transcript_102307:115-705(-)